MFKNMKMRELRAYIDGCHARKEYDEYFYQACAEWNFRNTAQLYR